MFTPKGKSGWYELMTSDTKAAGKFIRRLDFVIHSSFVIRISSFFS